MTGQIPDLVRYEGEEYSLSGVDGEGLFAPEPHGLRAQMLSTAPR